MGFVGISGTNHAVVMDAKPEYGGDGAAASPMEMVLMGLAGCSGLDVVSILQKKRVGLRQLEISLDAERAETHPKVFTRINVRFAAEGDGLTEKQLSDAVRLSMEKYCSVAGMLSKTAEINWSVEIL
jgi:putative redox protein